MKAFSLGGERGTGHEIAYRAGTNLPIWKTALLSQNSSENYSIQKWIDPIKNSAVKMEEGSRSQGWGRMTAFGSSATIGIRNFRQEYPKAILIDAEKQEMTAFFYSLYAEILDLRRYSNLT